MNNFEETVLNEWIIELQSTIENNSANGANRDGVCVWSDDDENKLYFVSATSDDVTQAYDLTINGAKQLESENDLDHSVKGYKSVNYVHDETVESAIDLLTIGSLNEWIAKSFGGDEYVIDTEELENDEITWDLLVDLMNRQRATDEDLLNHNYIWCGAYYKDTKAVDDLEDLYTFEEWSKLFETEDDLYDYIVEYAG